MGGNLADFLQKYIFVATPIIAWFVSQILKVIFYLVAEHQLNVAKLFDIGGMPSSHAAMVVSLATIIGLKEGVGSPLFGLSLIFAAIVIYDATNLRRASGEHAQTLNRIIPDLLKGKIIQPYEFKALYETLGHNPVEVLVGSILGFLLASLMSALISA